MSFVTVMMGMTTFDLGLQLDFSRSDRYISHSHAQRRHRTLFVIYYTLLLLDTRKKTIAYMIANLLSAFAYRVLPLLYLSVATISGFYRQYIPGVCAYANILKESLHHNNNNIFLFSSAELTESVISCSPNLRLLFSYSCMFLIVNKETYY